MHSFSSVSPPAAYEPFLFNGYVAVSGDNETKQVTLLRDTGAAQSIVSDTMFVLSPETYTNTDVFLHLGIRKTYQGFFICHIINYTGYN